MLNAFKNDPVGWIIMAVSLITTVVGLIDDAKQKAIQAAEEVSTKFKEAKESFSSDTASLNGLQEEFSRLSSGVDAYGNNISLTSKEYDTYLSLVKKIIDLSPSVCRGYDREGKAIVNYTTLLRDAIAEQERLAQQSREEYLGGGETLFKGSRKEYKDQAQKFYDTLYPSSIKGSLGINTRFLDGVMGGVVGDALKQYEQGLAIIQQITGQDYGKLESTAVSAAKRIQALTAIYERAEEVLAALRASGIYTDEQISTIQDKIYGLAGAYNTMKSIQDSLISYTTEWSKNQLWWDSIPTEAYLAFADGLEAVIDPMKDFDTNMAEVQKYGAWFSAAMNSDAVQGLLRMADGLKDGSVTLAQYNQELARFKAEFTGSGVVLDAVSSHLEGLADSAQNAEEKLASYTKNVKELKDVVSYLKDSGEILTKAQEEMHSGALSADTVKAIAGAMEEGENFLDYLRLENGQLKLNTEAWQERASASVAKDIAEIEKENESLSNQNEKLRENAAQLEAKNKLSPSGADWETELRALNNQIEQNNKTIRDNQVLLSLYPALLNELTDRFVGVSELLNWEETAGDLDKIGSTVGELISALKTLGGETALTGAEMAKLALAYPELLREAELFTTGTVAGQKAVLDSLMELYEAQYDALIDTKIAELNATRTVLESQIDLKKSKAETLVEIAQREAESSVGYKKWLTEKLSEFNEAEENGYVEHEGTILEIRRGAIDARLKMESDAAKDEKENIWQPMQGVITEAFAAGGEGALKALNTPGDRVSLWVRGQRENFLTLARDTSDTVYASMMDEGRVDSEIRVGRVSLNTEIGDVKVNGLSVEDWTSEQRKTISQRMQELREEIAGIDTTIKNLTALKGLDLASIYGTDKSGGGKSVEEYTADIDAYYAALKRLARAETERAKISDALENEEDLRRKVELERQMIAAYREEAAAQENLMRLKQSTIEQNVEVLRGLGFIVSYSRETNELFIANAEHLNELQADSAGKYDSLQEATNSLRKEMESLIDKTESLNDANRDSSDTLRELGYSVRSARGEIVQLLKDIVDKADDAVDAVQSVYDTLHAAADEYAEKDYITLDTLQSVLSLGTQYMQYLIDENGLLVINEESIKRVMAAKTDALAVEQALTYVERLRLALQKDSMEDLNELLYATTEATGATWDFVYANLALLGLDSEQYDAALHNINAIRSLSDEAVSGIWKATSAVGASMDDMKEGLDGILKYVMDMLKQRVNDQIDALEEMKSSFSEIISLRKEAMNAAKEESDYQDEIADKVKEIAKLQSRIDALSLDDSRDAQAQRRKLEEELADMQKELSDRQADYARDAQSDALDDMQSEYEKQKDSEIKVLEDSISSQQKLYDMAIRYISQNWDTLYQSLIGWNTEYGSVLNSEITSAWNNALAAAQKYGSYVSAMNTLGTTSSSSGSSSGLNYTVGRSQNANGAGTSAMVHAIIKEMYQNSMAHHTAGLEDQKKLDARNLYLGSLLSRYGIDAERRNDGVWYVNGSELLYEKYKQYLYHTGGIAGDRPTLRQNEVLAVLERGEAILDAKKEAALYRLIDFTTKFSDKFGQLLDMQGLGQALKNAQGGILASAASPSSQIRPVPNITFGDVTINGASDETAEKHREINREFTNEVLRHLGIRR